MGDAPLTFTQREAIDFQDEMREEFPEGHFGDAIVRSRLASHIDFSKADPDCDRCGGSGIRGEREMVLGGVRQKVVIGCQCLHKRGGVQQDMLDRMHETYRKMRELGIDPEKVHLDDVAQERMLRSVKGVRRPVQLRSQPKQMNRAARRREERAQRRTR